MRFSSIFLGLLFAGAISTSYGGHEIGKEQREVAPSEFPFVKGAKELEIGVGAFGSIATKGTPERPDVGLVLGQVRLGWMLTGPSGSGFLRGSLEGMVELYGAGIFEGPGSDLFGTGFILRYNFVQPRSHLVPFIQVEGGGAYSDMANDDSMQRLLGSEWSFTFGGEVGLRWLVNERFAITTGVEYRHTSNGDTASRNVGLNVLGGTLSLAWFF